MHKCTGTNKQQNQHQNLGKIKNGHLYIKDEKRRKNHLEEESFLEKRCLQAILLDWKDSKMYKNKRVLEQTMISIAHKIDKSYTFVIRLLSTSSHLSSLTSETSHTLLSPLSSHSTKKLVF